jgi:hypothetical protein
MQILDILGVGVEVFILGTSTQKDQLQQDVGEE